MSKNFRPKQTPKPAPTLMVGLPTGDTMQTWTCQSLLGLQGISNGTLFNFAMGSLVYDARNNITMDAIRAGVDRVLWIDSDMKFEPGTYLRLSRTMDETGADLVCGLYFTRKNPIEPVIMSCLRTEDAEVEGQKVVNIIREVYYDYPKDSVFEIEGCGFGVVLVKTVALRKVWEEFGAPFAPLPAMGEDLSACFRMRQLGAKLLCDSRVKAEHMGIFPVGEEDYVYDG